MLKQLSMVLALSMVLTACGSDDDDDKSSSSSSVASSSRASSVASSAPSSVASSAPSSVASSAPSSVASSAPSSVASSVASSVSSSSEASSSVASSSEASSSEASSSEASSSESSSSASAVTCDWETVISCDASTWVVDGGNGGTIEQGEEGPIFHNGAPSGTNSWNKPGMFFVLNEEGQEVAGKTLTLIVVVDQALKDTGAVIQPVIQEQGNSYAGYWSCQTNNEDLLVDGETTIECTQSGTDPADGIAALRLGFQLNGLTNQTGYAGTIEVVYASWE